MLGRRKFIHFSLVVFIIFFSSYFIISTIVGRRGLLTLVDLKKNLEYHQSMLQEIAFQKEKLNNKILGLYERSLDLDLLDEQVKHALVYVSPSEFMVILRE
jgi:cell division protein FtsB